MIHNGRIPKKKVLCIVETSSGAYIREEMVLPTHDDAGCCVDCSLCLACTDRPCVDNSSHYLARTEQ